MEHHLYLILLVHSLKSLDTTILVDSKTRLDIDLRSNYSPVEKIMTLLDNVL